MALAKIHAEPNGDLHVTHDGYEWQRVAGQWQMLANSGAWFDCSIQDYYGLRVHVADYECCLRAYRFEEGPGVPKGRKRGEATGDFIRRLQLQELRKDALNIFAPVRLSYSLAAARAGELAAHTRALAAPMPWRSGNKAAAYEREAYAEAMAAKRAKPNKPKRRAAQTVRELEAA